MLQLNQRHAISPSHRTSHRQRQQATAGGCIGRGPRCGGGHGRSCLFTDLATAHPICFDAMRYRPSTDWPSSASWVVIQAKPGARVEGSRYPGWGSGIIILGREGRGKEGRRSSSRRGVRYGTLLRIMRGVVTGNPGPGRGQSYVVRSWLRRIEESFVRAGRLRREWNGRSAGAAGAGWQAYGS